MAEEVAKRRRRLHEKIKRLSDGIKITLNFIDSTSTTTIDVIEKNSKMIELRTCAAEAIAQLFCVNGALRILDEIEECPIFFGFFKVRSSFCTDLLDAAKCAEVEISLDTATSDDAFVLVAVEEIKKCRDEISKRKWLLHDMITDIQGDDSFNYWSKVGNYYVPFEQIMAVTHSPKDFTMTNNNIAIEVVNSVTDVIYEGQFLQNCTSFYDAVRLNVADMVLDLN